MSVWAIGDLHLAHGVPEKKMDVFGPEWVDYGTKIKENWEALVSPDDLVLIPGDITWAMRLEEAKVDLDWIDALPGTKVMIRGNHDYWWSSLSKVKKILPPSIHVIQNDAFHWKNLSIGGARLWDSDEYTFDAYIEFREAPVSASKEEKPDREKIFNRELHRLELSLKGLDQGSDKKRLVMTHYPPIGADLKPSKVSALLERYNVEVCLFGHLHSLKPNQKLFGEHNGIRYILTSADYLDFKPIPIL